MSHARKRLWIAAAVAAVLAGLAFWTLTPSEDNRGVAFAEVRAQIERARTMTLTAVAEMKGMKRLVTMKMFFKAPGRMRLEQSIDPTAFLPRGATQPASMPAKRVIASIMDIASQKGLSLAPGMKRATTFEFKDLPPEAADKARNQDILGAWKKAVAGPHEDLGDKTIQGHKARGYRCRNAEVMNAGMDIWVDASTGTPLMVEMTTPDAAGGMKITMSDIVLDPPLDDSLFDLRPPAGYAVENKVVDYNASEADLIGYLDFFTSHFKGAFPRSLMSLPEIMEQLKEFKEQGFKEPTEQESKTVQALLQKTMVFLMKTMQGGEFVYAGKGVQRGDKVTPVLWYKAKDAKTYRVVYGDRGDRGRNAGTTDRDHGHAVAVLWVGRDGGTGGTGRATGADRQLTLCLNPPIQKSLESPSLRHERRKAPRGEERQRIDNGGQGVETAGQPNVPKAKGGKNRRRRREETGVWL
ncbi:MAG: hypothetical protein NT031_05935 [Planctomycetota bacterium]|nr:hypothetical protein [Planctomycetota bacterium]